ncbi:DNA repair protein RecN [Putridiphycobacter roseus]|uniref:DNA repair protein RecN n=1 Tax=Putridiphycobacter roseus TaxID=2219161 RepID=A0A2W1NA53_9FLAO|nr:DNA repair protein RecN [Putridiphycobacter roseus]PZE16175.1 DNA repair protein RecN [Putridiphycobacter roseus]
MLNRLIISNFALIDNLDLKFENGFVAITGETGAGKSILLKALNLLLGGRADHSALKGNEQKCIIEAEFNIKELDLKADFENWNIDYDDLSIVRREINPQGKSRLFINDTPTNVATLKSLGDKIINIHTQHETIDLLDKQYQLINLDIFANHLDLVQAYQKEYTTLQNHQHALKELMQQEAENRKEEDYTLFLFEEFEKINLEKIDIPQLLKEHEKLENWEHIQNQLGTVMDLMQAELSSPIFETKKGIEALSKIENLSTSYAALKSRLLSVEIELKDIEACVEDELNADEIDQEKAQAIKEKIEIINGLMYKHNVNTGESLLEIKQSLEDKIQNFSSVSTDIEKLEAVIKSITIALKKTATKIHDGRIKSIPKFEIAVQAILKDLGMENAAIKIDINTVTELHKNGFDDIEMLVKTNLGGQFLPISKSASGGELSRIMLAILKLTAKIKKLPTLIFDEIDTGVSGEIASKMAALFTNMGLNTQIISITHLPQIASKAKAHYHVFKSTEDNRTTTKVVALNKEERIHEIAKMMSGETITDKAIENAKILLN